MATKAQRFRRESERSKPKRKEGVTLEASAGKPSRKSTRRSKGAADAVGWNEEGVPSKRKGMGHVKAAAALTVRETMEQRAPSQRAQRGRMPSRGKAPAR